jgi:hypothetical protein
MILSGFSPPKVWPIANKKMKMGWDRGRTLICFGNKVPKVAIFQGKKSLNRQIRCAKS